MKRKRKIKKSRVMIVIMIIIIILGGLGYIAFNYIKNNNIELKKEKTIKEINSHYNEFVKTNKESKLYNSNNEVVGTIGNNVELSLDNEIISDTTKYFKITTFDDEYYISYKDVDKIDKLSETDNRYKNYIVFNENIVTNDSTSFYDENDNLLYTFNKSYDLPIIIKDDNKYGIEFNNRLLYVKKDDVKEIKKSNNTDKKNSTGIPVLNYHFAYEEDNPCYEEICHSPKQIKEHFSYIKDNNFFTPKMNELEMYIDQKIQLPQKSVVITFDDGTRADVAKKYVDEYKINATLFLITSWFNKEQFESEYFEVHSHGDNIHNGGLCSGGQGGEIKCMEHDKLLTDLKTSRDKLNGSTVFCYPFYEYNDYSIKVLKEAEFTMAFAGERAGGKIKVTPGIDKFRLPRWVIVNYTTQKQFISYVNGGS